MIRFNFQKIIFAVQAIVQMAASMPARMNNLFGRHRPFVHNTVEEHL